MRFARKIKINTVMDLPVFEQVLARKGRFTEESQWYLALAYLQKGDQVKAKDQLQAIQPEAFQYKAAQDILRALE